MLQESRALVIRAAHCTASFQDSCSRSLSKIHWYNSLLVFVNFRNLSLLFLITGFMLQVPFQDSLIFLFITFHYFSLLFITFHYFSAYWGPCSCSLSKITFHVPDPSQVHWFAFLSFFITVHNLSLFGGSWSIFGLNFIDQLHWYSFSLLLHLFTKKYQLPFTGLNDNRIECVL